MNFVTRFFVLFMPILLIGCSYISKSSIIQTRDKQYLSARSIPPLRVPPGIASSAFQATYPVSDRQYPEAAKEVSDVPPGL